MLIRQIAKNRLSLLLLAALVLAPVFAPTTQVMLTLALAKSLAVLGIIVLLQAGQVSFGHALFYAVSAYTAAFLGRSMAGGELILNLLSGVIVAALTALLVGLFVVRYREIFFGMLNLAVSMIFFSFLEKFYHITGGSDGLSVPRPTVLGFTLERAGFEVVLYYRLAGAGTVDADAHPPLFILAHGADAARDQDQRGAPGISRRVIAAHIAGRLCGLGGAVWSGRRADGHRAGCRDA